MGLARLQARLLELVPGKPLTRDQLLMLSRDNVASADLPGLTDLGVVPTPVELVVPTAISQRFRPGGGTRRVPPDPSPGTAPEICVPGPRHWLDACRLRRPHWSWPPAPRRGVRCWRRRGFASSSARRRSMRLR